MSSFSFSKAFGKEKPHSSVTDWIEILTNTGIEEEAYDGIPELVDAMNLQAAGCAEASRALRKKIKHGGPHQQYRALVLLKALVENGGTKFQTSFADGQMTETLRHLGNDINTDKRVKRKLLAVLASWKNQFKDDPSMALVANLHRQCKPLDPQKYAQQELAEMMGLTLNPAERAKDDLKAEKKKQQERDEAAKKRQEKKNSRRRAFNFEQEKPKIISSIAEASQASNNLVNAVKLVNPQNDCVETNERVQDCLAKAKQAKKYIMRYIQLVENEELIGTLIEVNESLTNALEYYEDNTVADPDDPNSKGKKPSTPPAADEELANKFAQASLSHSDSDGLFQSNAADGTIKAKSSSPFVHPDLEDLSFGPLGAASSGLPPPIRPSTALSDGDDDDREPQRPSLSDFSDYESSDEETSRNPRAGPSGRRDYATVSDSDGEPSKPFTLKTSSKPGAVKLADNPFADPFADR